MFRLPRPQPADYGLKTRQYCVIAFLEPLPVLGVALALAAIELSRRDDAALDRAARGTINLERLNGPVYAVVMESRGIHMSADWTAAEPFAKNLSASFTASPFEPVEHLGGRVDLVVVLAVRK